MNKYDILFLCETWLKDDNYIEINGFVKLLSLNRDNNIGTRNEGGLAIFCRSYLIDGISIEKELK